MAEFCEVSRGYIRMCESFGETCEGCPISACSGNDIYVCKNRVLKNPEKYEGTIMQWAADHPEPVYPSIAKYLEQFGITIRRDGSLQADFFKANEPMGADMAKLLGISLGEGENEKTD